MKTTWIVAVRVLCLSCLLAACGGGGGGGSTDSGGVKETATQPTPVSKPVNKPAPAPVNPPVSQPQPAPVPVPTNPEPIAPAPTAKVRTVAATSCPVQQQLGDAQQDGLHIAAVHWLQVVSQSGDDPDTVLAGEKAVRVRVDVLADKTGIAPVNPMLHVYDPRSQRCQSIRLRGPATYPKTTDPLTLKTAFVADLPADLVRTGIAVVVDVASASGRTPAEADKTYVVLKPQVAAAISADVHFIPLTMAGHTGQIKVTPAEAASLLSRLFPYSKVTTHIDAPLKIVTIPDSEFKDYGLLGILFDTANQDNDKKITRELHERCQRLNPNKLPAHRAVKCIGLLPTEIKPTAFAGGRMGHQDGWVVNEISGTVLVAPSLLQVDDRSVHSPDTDSHWLSGNALTLAHEYGHLLSLDHAGCGAQDVERRFHTKGTLGMGEGGLGAGAGYDRVRDFYFSAASKKTDGTPRFHDLMSYCDVQWMSDLGYRQAIHYLATGKVPKAPARSSADILFKISEGSAGWQSDQVTSFPVRLEDVWPRLKLVGYIGNAHQYLSLQAEPGHLDSGPYYARVPGDKDQYSLLTKDGGRLKNWVIGH